MNENVCAGEYTDSGVGSEAEAKYDIRNEEGDVDSDTESSPPLQDTLDTNDENKISDDYTVSCPSFCDLALI